MNTGLPSPGDDMLQKIIINITVSGINDRIRFYS